MELIAVVMHCKSSQDRFESAKALLNYGFSNYALTDPAAQAQIEAIPVVLGQQEQVQPVMESAGAILIDKALANAVTCEAELEESVRAPVEKGQRLGTLYVRAQGRTLAEIPLVAPEEIPALSWADIVRRMLRRVCMAET